MFDDEGFAISYDLTEKEEINKFFNIFGFVVIRDVLNDEEIKETTDEFFESFQGGENASDEELESFYNDQPFSQFGIIGVGPDLKSISQLNNRQNPKVHKAFSTVLNCDDLIVEHDRLGALRPTMRASSEKKEWRTRDRWIHLDCNPMKGTASIGGFKLADDPEPIDFDRTLIVQGLLTLTDAREQDGGFHCIPAAHIFSHKWAEGKSSMQVDPNDPISADVVKIPLRKGCLLVWNSLLFHGNHPNHSDKWRIVQYIRMLPAKGTPYSPLYPELKDYPYGFQMTSLGEKLFGIRH